MLGPHPNGIVGSGHERGLVGERYSPIPNSRVSAEDVRAMQAHGRLGIDVVALAVIAVEMNPAVSGLAVHDWLGILLVVPLAIHLILNWDWVTAVMDRRRRTRPTMLADLVVDTGLFLSMVGVGVSGVLLLPGFARSLAVSVSPVWHAVHLATANLTVVFCVAHVALHARWMLNATRHVVKPRAGNWRASGHAVASPAHRGRDSSSTQPAGIRANVSAQESPTPFGGV
jgi:Domain of unknown function (DUF4405)